MKSNSCNRKQRYLFFFFSLFIFLLLISILLIDSNFRIVTTEYELSYTNLPPSFNGFRIVLLADIHDTQFGTDNEQLISHVQNSNPDIIVIAGDLLNAYKNRRPIKDQLDRAEALIINLISIAPVYFVNGNHETSTVVGRSEALESALIRHGAYVLKDEYVMLSSGSDSILLAGVDADIKMRESQIEFVNALRTVEGYPFIILIEHRNDNLQRYSGMGVDLLLSGHAHGGVIRLPFIGGLIGQDRGFFPDFTDGVYSFCDTRMLVSRGLGNPAFWPRFLNNPHIAVAVLQNKG